MIYFVFSPEWAKHMKLPEVISLDKEFGAGRIPQRMLYGATFIFEFKEGKVIYHKIRSGIKHTEEELVVLKLRAVPA